MEKYIVNTPNKEVMGFDDFQNLINDAIFDEVSEFDLKKEIKYFEDSQVLIYTVTFKDGSIVQTDCVTKIM